MACAKGLGHKAACPFQDQEGKFVVGHRMWSLRTVLSRLGVSTRPQSTPAPSLVHMPHLGGLLPLKYSTSCIFFFCHDTLVNPVIK